MARLQDLLEMPALELELLAGEAESEYRIVVLAGASLPRAGSLILAGTGFWESRPEPARLLASGPAAIGVQFAAGRRGLPGRWSAEAARRSAAIFAVPPAVNLARVQSAALSLLARDDPGALETAAALHAYLEGALDSPKPERDLLERLHSLTGGSYLLLSPWNTVLARSGPAGRPPQGLDAAQLQSGRMRLGSRLLQSLRIEDGGRLQSVLVLRDPGHSPQPLLDLAGGVLRLAARARRAEAQSERALRGALLSEWLSGGTPPAELEARLADMGFEPQAGFMVAVCEPGEKSRPNRQRRQVAELQQAGDTYFQALGLPVLEGERGGHCLWLVGSAQPEAHLAPLTDALGAGTDEPFRLGLSSAPPGHAAAAAYRQALLAAQTVSEPQGGRIFSNLDPVSWMLEQQPQANLQALHDRLVGPIRRADESGKLWRTLVAYLREPGDMQGLAARLHIHVNTLRYRLGRIEDLIGLPLSKPETLARLHLAEQIDGMLEAKRRG